MIVFGCAMWGQCFLVLILLSKNIFSYQPNAASKKRARTSHFAGGFSKASKDKKPATAVVDQRQTSSQVVRYVTKKGNGASAIANHCPTFNMLYPGIRAVHSDPPIFEVDNFFSKTLCESYISRSLLGTEIVCQPLAGSEDTRRTSQTRYLQHSGAMEIIEAAHKLTGITSEKFEEPQVVRYLPGQQFTWHYDAIQPHLRDSSGNRIATLIVYLNDCESGGETVFRDLDLKVKPEQGKALIFFPSYKDGLIDDRTLHCGSIAVDEKWIAQIWIREGEYTPDMRDALRMTQLRIHKEASEKQKKLPEKK